ncbi:DUF2971 domain-containing protein [Salmonella enterica]|uniref:DUF2971 domain-containing protein n=1 Tax=Lonsdalea quercina TaxID=71657 RepID=UPI0019A37645|nr:DUF2971 domain-containing protein [Salmonella enterica]
MLLYHYTDQNGFIGIIENKQLWATKIQYLNDSKELYLAFEFAKKILQDKLPLADNDNCKARIERLMANLSNITHINICVCSLSEIGDLLSQWRGYSNKQGGYSIGFDVEELKIMAKKNNYRLEKCIYDENEQISLIKEIIDETLNIFISYEEPNPQYPEYSSKSSEYFNERIISSAPLIKSKTFGEEQEWRLISSSGISLEKLSFRPGTSMLIPYHKIKFRDDFWNIIRQVIVGHTPHLELALNSTDSFIYNQFYTKKHLISKESDFSSINIMATKIPYRSW